MILIATIVFVVSVAGVGDASSQTKPTLAEVPTPSIGPKVDMIQEAPADVPAGERNIEFPRPQGAPPLGIFFGGFNFDTNAVLSSTYFIPPDPHGASGPFHVVNVGNTMIQWFDKTGTQQYLNSLKNFFAPIGPPLATNTFDPKVIYDQYSERFVVVTLERITAAPEASAILVAVSKTSDPNLGWWYMSINSKVNIGGTDHWADYPGFAVGPNAVYITNNMFSFPSTGGTYGGVRLWIVHKNPFYTGGAPVWTIHDPYTAAGSIATTTQPSHMFGPVQGSMGTFLCSYSGLSAAPNEFVQVVRVDNPIVAPTFTQAFIPVGDIEGPAFPSLPDAPQLGTASLIEVNDRRALNAVWRDNQLYISTTLIPNSGVDAGHTTAHWFKLDTSNLAALGLMDQGDVGAEDLGVDTYTFFPSVMVDKCGNMGVGFSASSQTIYTSACYTGRLASDPPGTVQSTGMLAAGQDWYLRTFGSGRNRWGDYSAIGLDPADEVTFWVFNEYAMMRGTPLSGEDGRWATQWGSFALGCQPVAVAVTSFEAVPISGGVELRARFSSDSERFRVDVYRGEGGSPGLYKSLEAVAGEDFRFVDGYVEPGKTYRYHLAVEDEDGRFLSPTSEVTIPVRETVLLQNKPNPFNPVTTIRFVLPAAQPVTLSVYDSSGKLVRTLVTETRGVGPHEVEWDGTDNMGNRVGSGVYFYRLDAGKFQQSRKMLLLK
jgi:hypothetical protein